MVKSWLANKGPSNGHRWLLVMDNADSLSIDYSEYMPSGKGGDVLLTTRNPECAMYHTVGSEVLHGLELELALKLLLKASSLPESQWEENRKAAMVIVEILGSHTLAIIQAGAYVRQKLCSLKEYPLIFQKLKGSLLQFHSTANIATYGNVYKTFEVSAEYLGSSGLPKNLDALNLLHIIAFMHNSGISETMFQRAADYATKIQDLGDPDFDLSIGHISRLPEYMQHGWSNNLQDRQRWREALAVLESLSLITVRNMNESIEFSLHPLVHYWAKERQNRQVQCIAWKSAATILAMSCEGRFKYIAFFFHLQSHVRVCVSHEIQKCTSDMSATEAAQLLIQLAYVLYRTGDDRSLDLLIQQLRSRLQDRDDVNLSIREVVKVFIARVARAKGNSEEALHVLRKLVEDRAQRLPEDHPDRLEAEQSLACAYQDNRQINEAVELLEHVAKIRQKLAQDHSDRLASQHELAIAYLANDQTIRAMELLEHVVKFQEKLAEDHPDRLTSQQALARVYLENGQIDKSMKLLEYVVKVQKKLAEDYPKRLTSQLELARAYKKNGQIDESIKLNEYVVKIREKLEEDHPGRLVSQHELARAYLANGQIDESIELFEHVVKVRREKLAEDHPKRLISEHNLAAAYRVKGRIDESIELYEHMVKIRREKVPQDHRERLSSEHELAQAYKAKGRIDEAIELLQHVVKIRREKLAEYHPDRIASERALAEANEGRAQNPKA